MGVNISLTLRDQDMVQWKSRLFLAIYSLALISECSIAGACVWLLKMGDFKKEHVK